MGPLGDLLEVFQQGIESVPSEHLMTCFGRLEERIAEATALRRVAFEQKAWKQFNELQKRIAMFENHMDRIGQELGRRP